MTDKEVEIHREALDRFNRIQEAQRDERIQCLEDRRFCTIAGAQFEGDLGKQYENKPKIEVNKVHMSVVRIVNEYRNNRITVNFDPKHKGQDQLADLANQMFRADEHHSDSEEAKDNCFEELTQGGMGAIRLRADYEDEFDENNDKQRIYIEPIYDADVSVYFDLAGKKADKSDAMYCFLVSTMQREDYKAKYDDDPASWPRETLDMFEDWESDDHINIAEYYWLEDKKHTMVYFEGLDDEEQKHWLYDLTDEKKEELEALGFTEVRRRKVLNRRVRKCIMSGGKILEDCGYIAGKMLPIAPGYGKRWYVENIERCMGHVRLAKDAQRLKNMQLSKLAEISALSSTEKPILAPEQIGAHKDMWERDNIDNYAYLLLEPLLDAEGNVISAGPLDYTRPTSVPPALAALLQLTEEDMKDILGRPEAGDEIQSHISGKAVELVQQRLDMMSYIYMSNFAKCLRRVGQIWLSMAKDVYVEDDREVQVIDNDGKHTSKKIRIRGVDENGEIIIDNDLEAADFEVNVSVGPSSSSKREAVVRQATSLLQFATDPQDQKILSATAMMNMEGEGMSGFREYYRKQLVQMGVEQPTEADIAEAEAAAQNPPEPTPNDQYLLAEAQKAEAEAQRVQSEIMLKQAQAQKTMAEAQQLGAPQPEAAPQGPTEDPYREGELVMQAKKAARELEIKEGELALKQREMALKEQEIALKEQEQTAKLAETGLKLMQAQQQESADAASKAEVKEGHQAAVEMAKTVANAMAGLQSSMDEAAKDRKEAMTKLDKPHTIRRDEAGNIVGLE